MKFRNVKKKKGKGARGGEGGAAATPKTSPKSATPVLNMSKEVACLCGSCAKQINEEEEGKYLACDHCHAWYHLECSSLDNKAFDFIDGAATKYKSLCIRWFCEKCPQEATPGSPVAGVVDKQRSVLQDAKIDKLSQMFAVMQTQLDSVLSKIGDEKKEQSVALGQPVSEVLQDHRETDEKMNNLMVFNLAEAKDEESEVAQVKALLSYVNSELGTDTVSKKNIVRLGQKKTTGDQKPRPLKIVFEDSNTKWQYIKHAKKLSDSDKFKRVGLSFDKTTKERLEDEKLRADLAAERIKRPDDDLIIFRKQIIKRADKQEVARAMRNVSDNAVTGGSSTSD